METDDMVFPENGAVLKLYNLDAEMHEESAPCINKQNNLENMKNFVSQLRRDVADRKLIVDILAIFFGIGAWIGVNGMFVQLPLLVEALPERWSLPSYMSITVQLANIGPLLYSVLRKFVTSKYLDSAFIYAVLTLGCITAFLMSFLYQITSIIGGEERSTVFLILCFFTSLVGCTSSVLFMPYIRHFRDIYLLTYFIGEGLSGFIPSIIALIQGIGGNPECIQTHHDNGTITTELLYHDARFSTKYFLLIIAILLTASLISFYLLNNLKTCQSERVPVDVMPKDTKNNIRTKEDHENDLPQNEQVESEVVVISKLRYVCLLLLIGVVAGFSNGLFPSIQSYSCLPYGNTAYHLSVTLGNMANPVACFIAIFLPRTSNRSLILLSTLCAVFASYVISTSVLSPTPPLVGTHAGEAMIVVAWIILIGLVSYVKLSISTIFRSVGGSGLFHCGAVSQIGSAIISVVIFLLINYTNIFKQSDPCL